MTDARDDPLSLGFLLVTDELQASTYAMMTGFYRQSIAELRSALEAMLMGVYFHRHPDAERFKRWADGDQGDVGTFHRARGSLARSSPFNLFNNQPEPLTSLMKQGGWVDFLYSTLSGFSHGRPYYVNRFGDRIPSMNVELWGGSNGPIYEDRAVRLWTTYYFDIHLLIVLLAGLAEPRLATLSRPTDIPYAAFVGRLFAWHPYPLPVARAIARHLLGS